MCQAGRTFFASLKNREKTALSKNISVLILQVGIINTSKSQPTLTRHCGHSPVKGQPGISSPKLDKPDSADPPADGLDR